MLYISLYAQVSETRKQHSSISVQSIFDVDKFYRLHRYLEVSLTQADDGATLFK